MDIKVSSYVEADVLVIEPVGVITDADDERILADNCYNEILKHGLTKVLVDQTQTDFRSSIVDQCDVVAHYIDEFSPKIRRTKIALVVQSKDRELHDFWELYANNRGYRWKVFTDKESALSYLLEE